MPLCLSLPCLSCPALPHPPLPYLILPCPTSSRPAQPCLVLPCSKVFPTLVSVSDILTCNNVTYRCLQIKHCAEKVIIVNNTVCHTSAYALQALHAAGLVHRDVKPMNIIFAEDEKRFKLIDLGACADLRSGTNYIPDESILDPTYCPPEQVQSLNYCHLPLLCCRPNKVRESVCDTNHTPDAFILDPTNCPPEQLQRLYSHCWLCCCGLQNYTLKLHDRNSQDVATAKLQHRQELFKAGCWLSQLHAHKLCLSATPIHCKPWHG